MTVSIVHYRKMVKEVKNLGLDVHASKFNPDGSFEIVHTPLDSPDEDDDFFKKHAEDDE